jgi:dipeptidyl aminopeptidase/acylaminoacyl peptidase
VSDGVQQCLTPGDGQHEIVFSPDGTQFIDTASSPSMPPVSELRNADGTRRSELWRADIAALLATGWTVPEEVVVTAADGHTALHGVLYKPPHFDPAQRYPLMQWVYGGPQMVHASHVFAPRPGGSDAFVHAMTDAGYLVLTLDARGTPGRDKAFQDIVYREWGEHVVADQAGALRQLLAARSYIDPARLGVAGRSWGGYFALRLLAQAGELYRAASCIVPGFNPYGGNIWEPYLGLPQDDPRPYQAAEPWGWPQQLSRSARVQLIGGMLDSSTLWDLHRMARLLVEADVSTQMLVLPEQDHVFEGLARRFHYRAVRDFFDEALMP